MSNGTPQGGVTVNFTIVAGSGTLSAPSATTDANGYATVTLTLTQVAANVRVNACVSPANAPCQNIFGNVVASSLQSLQPVTGAGQAIALGQAFQPVMVRVVDNSSPPNPVVGSVVTFQSTVLRPVGDAPGGGSGETGTGNPAQPVILGTSLVNVQSDGNGLASIVPSVGAFNGALEVDVLVTAGTNAMLHYVLQAFPAAVGGTPSVGTTPPRRPVTAPVRLRFEAEEP
jgi:hypothetical protein